ncbi:hypothetical protein [Kribbella sp. CA-293567]|uniref:hypothetical protein n=1 Tax=Kribbella sp. CA-293567 TaxID=3002436 RepID=UPI0022DD8FD9|nr:hypothetical protein [Kribbella sp. CA-293567]WBQ05207.1 hypothetical protein OX958_00050 [Kribbella sp. CA-293567]
MATLVVFCVLYSVGAALAGVVKEERAVAVPVVVVKPEPLPSPVLLPGIVKPQAAPYVPAEPGRATGLVGVTYQFDDDVQQVVGLGLPFVFGWPRPPTTADLGVSANTLYRRVTAETVSGAVTLDAKLALRPCASLAACLADRQAFDQEWTSVLEAPVPAVAKDASTWLTVSDRTPYTLTMTHAFTSNGRSWLIGVSVIAVPGEEPAAQRVLNDIWRQTR